MRLSGQRAVYEIPRAHFKPTLRQVEAPPWMPR